MKFRPHPPLSPLNRICRLVGKGWVGLIVACLTLSYLAAAQPDGDLKIDSVLIRQLIEGADSTAPFFVFFGARASFDPNTATMEWKERGVLVVNRLRAAADSSQAGVRRLLEDRGIEFVPYWVENRILVPHGTLELARELAGRAEVAALVPDRVIPLKMRPGAVAAVSAGTPPWNITRIGADQVWTRYNNTGAGIVVANIDSGVQYNHPALVSQYRGNLGGGKFDHSQSWYDPTGKCVSAPCDDAGHGTHTMGTMVGDDGAGHVTGVAPGAKWIACKACNSERCLYSALTSCAQWILAPGGDPARRPNIVNNSWGSEGGQNVYENYIRAWVAAGIFPAFSIGDDGPDCGSAASPGDNPEAFSSGATDSADRIGDISSRGPSSFGAIKPNIVAPGVDIYSSLPSNLYGTLTGTSMASPHTAATVALLWAIRPAWLGQVAATANLLQSHSAPLAATSSCSENEDGAVPNLTYGYGRLNAGLVVDAAAGSPPPVSSSPAVAITRPSLNGQQFECGALVTFQATAADPSGGDLSSSVKWLGPGNPGVANGGSTARTFSCQKEVGSQMLTATATNRSGATGADTVVVNIVNASGPPAAPSNLSATLSSNGVNLSWEDNSARATGYRVFRRRRHDSLSWGPWISVLGITHPGAVSATDTGVVVGTCQYYVVAANAAGLSTPSNVVTISPKTILR